MPVIIGALPPHDSKLTNTMRMFADSRTDYKGPARLLNTAATRIKKQVGGGKATKTIVLHSDSEGDTPLCFSPSPAPMKLCSMTHKGNTAEPPKPKHVRKRVDVVVPTITRNRPPSIISLMQTQMQMHSNIPTILPHSEKGGNLTRYELHTLCRSQGSKGINTGNKENSISYRVTA